MRKFLALVLALVMTMSLVTISAGAATDFTDDAKIVNTEAVEVLSEIGILGGYADGSFRPEATLTRGAGAKLIAYLMLGQTAADNLKATYTVFEDVTDSVGLAPYIEWAAANGIVGGYGDGNFGPYNTLTEYAFGKMLLTALGYDADLQGYSKAGWQKAVYRDAIASDIYDGTESYGACTRDTAARMVLATLKADMIVYGSKTVNGGAIINGVYVPGIMTDGVTVTGAMRTDYELYNLYTGLGLAEGVADVWGNLGDRWTYTPTQYSKHFQYPTVATYTEQVEYCDLLVDLGIPANSSNKVNLTINYNGTTTTDTVTTLGHAAAHADCDNHFIGGQGVLTKVFATATAGDYVVTEVATYLALVDRVAPGHAGTVADFTVYNRPLFQTNGFGTDNAQDIVTEMTEDTLDINNIATDAYAQNDYALVTVANGTTIVTHELATPVAGTLSGYFTAGQAAPNAAFTYVTGVKTMDAFGFVLNNLEDATADDVKNPGNLNAAYNFFYDSYGNLIGAVKPAASTSYLVLDAVWSYTDGLGVNKIGADVVGLDAVTTEAVNVATWEGVLAALVPEATIEERRTNTTNVGKCTQLYTYSVDANGNYALADATVLTIGTKGDAIADVTRTSVVGALGAAQLTANTQFVVRDVNGDYKAYTGYQNLPLLTADYAEYVMNSTNTGAAVVYIHGAVYDGAKVNGYIANAISTGAFYHTDSNRYYAFNLYVDGVAREVYMLAADHDAVVAGGAGVYEVQFNAVDGLLAVNGVTKQTTTADATCYLSSLTINYATCAADKKIAFTGDGNVYDLVNTVNGVATDVEVYVVSDSHFTVTAGTFADLVNGRTVDVFCNKTVGTVIYEIYVHVA